LGGNLQIGLNSYFCCAGTYDPSEEMTAKLFPKVFQAAFEVRGATIPNGKCSGCRISGQQATIKFPSVNMSTVTIHAAWAKSYSSGVKLVVPFALHPSHETVHQRGSDADEF
jgi:hypothetical protein